ncbi:hypothetical protein Plhal304r1_c059g0146921 [Plasmopara halstedii]
MDLRRKSDAKKWLHVMYSLIINRYLSRTDQREGKDKQHQMDTNDHFDIVFLFQS